MTYRNNARTTLTSGAAFAGAGILTMGLMTAAPPSDAVKFELQPLLMTTSAFSPMAYSTAIGADVPSTRALTPSSVPVQPIPAASTVSSSGQSWLAPALATVCAISVVCGVVAVGLIVGSVVLAPVLYPVLRLVLPIVAKIRDALAGFLGLPLPSTAAARVAASAKPASRTRATATPAATPSKRTRPNVVVTQDRSHRTGGFDRAATAKRSEGRQRHGSR